MSQSQSNSREWNAAEYHHRSVPQFEWGQRVLSELHLRGDECVLDAGCGTGKLTRLLAQNLPRGRVIGVDVSRNMVMHAQRDLRPEFGERAQFVAADLIDLPFLGVFDGIFSTASFHWVLDHDTLFRNLFAVLRPGGWLHAQCGRGSNLARLRQHVRVLSKTADYSRWLREFPEPWFFSDADSAASGLRSAGFEEVLAGLEAATIIVASAEVFKGYLRTFILHRHLDLLPTELLRETFVEELTRISALEDPQWTLDYTRLNLRARKPELPR
jgi:trans-aconitate 2-methyltransferase